MEANWKVASALGAFHESWFDQNYDYGGPCFGPNFVESGQSAIGVAIAADDRSSPAVVGMESNPEVMRHALEQSLCHELEILSRGTYAPLPSLAKIAASKESTIPSLPEQGIGTAATVAHLIQDITPGFNGSSLSSTYFGFVTGGATPAAKVADRLATIYDQNTLVHFPDQSTATIVEARATDMLADLLSLDSKAWKVRILTTGATAGNILGLACGRQWALESRIAANGGGDPLHAVSMGLLKACESARIDEWQILTSLPHSSLRKAANIVGLGAGSIIDVGLSKDLLTFDMKKLEDCLMRPNTASVVVISCGEVNTGGFATHSYGEVEGIRRLCDKYGAWLHVDGAFGIFARCLVDSGSEFQRIADGGSGMELADSISGDGHKMLNVPYDCGFFFNKQLELQQRVFQNPGAVYLSTQSNDVPSALNLAMENSRRFRGLPLYATLVASGRQGYVDMIKRQVRFARAVAEHLADHPGFELLPTSNGDFLQNIFMIVLFRAKDTQQNKTLVRDINQKRQMYVSGTVWDDQPAARIAVSNWKTSTEQDIKLVLKVLDDTVKQNA